MIKSNTVKRSTSVLRGTANVERATLNVERAATNVGIPQLSTIVEANKPGILTKPVTHALIFRLTGLGLIFLLQVLLARLMGPAAYGDYTVIATTINLFLVLSVFGFDSSVQRFLPAYLSNDEQKKATGFVKFAYRLVTVLSIACSIGLFIFLISKSKRDISFSEGFFWGLLLLPFLANNFLSSAILRSLGKIKTSLLSTYFLVPVVMGISCLIYFSTYQKLTVDATMLIYFSCIIVISIYFFRKTKKVLNDRIKTSEVSTLSRKWISVSSILFLTTALDLLLRQSDILMVSYYLGNTQAGQYNVAAKLAVLASLGLSVVDYVFMPKISALFESKQYKKLQKMVSTSSLQILSITLPVIFVLFIGGKWILGLFGNSFNVSYVPLVILLIGQTVNASTGMVGGLMSMTGHQKKFFIFYAAAFILQFTLNIFMIPKYGIIGAAIGSSASICILNLLGYQFVSRKLKIKASFF